MARIFGDDEARFWQKIEAGPIQDPALGPCWLWTADLTTEGYGQFRVKDRSRSAHRWGYSHFIGDPGPLVLDHLCRVRRCVNPKHLEPVTMRENTRRGWLAIITDAELLAEVTKRGLSMSPSGTDLFESSVSPLDSVPST
jgi:hypothetical protein